MELNKLIEIVINTCYGGYQLSKEAYEKLELEWDGYGFAFEDDRSNPKLIKVVKELGSKKVSGGFAKLKIVKIPDNIDWYIDEYDGMEHIAERHRTWG